MTTAKPMLTNSPERAFVRRFCHLYIQKLRAILAKNPPKGNPCDSCAFAPHTDSCDGFESTIWNLIQAMQKGAPFYCHRNLETVNGDYVKKPGLKGMIPCNNYEAIRHCPDVERALKEAAVESEPIRRT
jgi:hypothetical protein